jgi:hypothetical protein
MTDHILEAPPAQNLTILTDDSLLFKKSFAYNKQGNFYIVNQFDFTAYTQSPSVEFFVNDIKASEYTLYLFKDYNIVYFKEYYFIFINKTCNIKKLIKVDRNAHSLVNSLLKLSLNGQATKRNLIYQLLKKEQKTLKYGRGRFSSQIPLSFLKDETYEIVFQFRVSGYGMPIIMVAQKPFSPDDLYVRHYLDNSIKNKFRKTSILFTTKTLVEVPTLHLLIRGKRRFKGEVTFKNIYVYHYETNLMGNSGVSRSKIAYLDFIKKLKREFIGFKVVTDGDTRF